MSDALKAVHEGLDAFNAHDEERIRAGYAPDAIFEGPGDVRLEGPEAITGYAMSWLNAFPDARMNIHHEAASGDWVFVRATFEGTHENPLPGPEGEIPPTHKHLVGRAAQAWRVAGGKIAEEHLYYDQMQVLTQLGLVPEAATTA